MWNTGIRIVYNNTGVRLSWTDLETRGNIFGEAQGEIPPGHNARVGLVAPWCSNTYDVSQKALRIASMQDPRIIDVFQNLIDNQIYWVREPVQSWADAMWGLEGPSSLVNLAIGEDGNGDLVVTVNATG